MGLIAEVEQLSERFDVLHSGVRVTWRRFGSGKPLVLIHGGHGNWMHWLRNIRSLSRWFELWIPDLPGFGDSDAPGPTVDSRALDSLVELTQATLLQLLPAGRSVGIGGFSFGALVATRLAVSLPRIERVALLGPAAHGGERRFVDTLVNWRDAQSALEMKEAQRTNLASLMFSRGAEIDDVALDAHTTACLATRFYSKGLSRGDRLIPALDNLKKPVLAIWGAHDVTGNPRELGPKLCSAPERKWLVVPDVGHWVQFQQPDVVNAALINWFLTEED